MIDGATLFLPQKQYFAKPYSVYLFPVICCVKFVYYFHMILKGKERRQGYSYSLPGVLDLTTKKNNYNRTMTNF